MQIGKKEMNFTMHTPTDRHRTPLRREAGFTLAELLVVVAIVGVLVAIAIPTFITQLEKAEAATCESNRRSLKSMVTIEAMFNKDADQPGYLNDLLTDCMKQLGAQTDNNTLCPKKGTYSIQGNLETGGIAVKCSIHGLSMDEELYLDILGTFNGSWHEIYGSNGKLGSDTGAREEYAKIKNIDSWPLVYGTDGKAKYYLQFKSYGDSSDTTFLYAGTDSNPQSRNAWNTRYICDSTGLLGEDSKGQWYELPKQINIGTRGEDALRTWLTAEGVKKVNLVNGKFEAAS